MPEVEVVWIKYEDEVSGVTFNIYPAPVQTPYVGPSGRSRIKFRLKNNTDVTKLVTMDMYIADELYVERILVLYPVEEKEFEIAYLREWYELPHTIKLEFVGVLTVTFDVKRGWSLTLKAFSYDGTKDKTDMCTFEVTGYAYKLTDTIYMFADKATATVKAYPKHPYVFSHFIIGGTKVTSNPATFPMVYYNYAYAYMPALPSWLAWEDVNFDGKVDMIDIFKACKLFGKTRTDPEWDENVDVHPDGKIDMREIWALAKNFGSDAAIPSELKLWEVKAYTVSSEVQSGIMQGINAAAVGSVSVIFLDMLAHQVKKAMKAKA